MNFRPVANGVVTRVSALAALTVAAPLCFAQFNLTSLPPEFGSVSTEVPSNVSLNISEFQVFSTEDFFPQIFHDPSQKQFKPENPDTDQFRRNEVPRYGDVGGLTGGSDSLTDALFPGLSEKGWVVPPDPHMTVGKEFVVQVVNSQIGFFDKSTGEETFSQDLGNFFGSASSGFPFDPRVIYDQYNDRYVVFALELDQGAETSTIIVGFSDDDDPHGTWTSFVIDSVVAIDGVDYWFDYPMVGYNADAIVVSGNLFGFNGGFGATQTYVIPTAPPYAGDEMTVTGFLDATIFSIHPASTMGTSEDYIYGMAVLSSGQFRVYAWGDVGTPTPTMQSTTVSVTNSFQWISTVDANGDFLDPISWRTLDCDYRDGMLLTAHTVAAPGGANQARVQWYEFDVDTWPVANFPVQVQIGEILLPNGNSAIQPAISKNVNGDISVLFTRTGPSITADMMVATRKLTDPIGVLGLPVQFTTSSSTWPYYRWGDYFAVVVDPVDDATFWGNGESAEFANNDYRWKTEIQSWVVTAAGGGGFNYGTTQSMSGVQTVLGTYSSGNVFDVTESDNLFYDIDSELREGIGYFGAAEAEFAVSTGDPDLIRHFTFSMEAILDPGREVTATMFIYNYSTGAYEYLKSFSVDEGSGFLQRVTVRSNIPNYLSEFGDMKLLIRAHDPYRRNGRSPEPFQLKFDVVQLQVLADEPPDP